MDDPTLDLTLDIAEEGADAERIDELTRFLREDLYDFGLESVERPSGEPPPSGAKGDPFTLGALALVTVPAVLPALIRFLQDWTLRGEGRMVRIKTPTGIELEFEPDRSYTDDELFALVEKLSTIEPADSKERQAGIDQKGFDRVKILFLAANPKNTSPLRLGEEVRAIDESLQKAAFRDKFDLEQQHAVRVGDLQEHLLRYSPDIVHFSGHGSTASMIIFEDEAGLSQTVPPSALSNLFKTLKDNIRCVVLNACYSDIQAVAIAEHIDCVIGMSTAIGDKSAIKFAQAFYRGIGYGKDVKTAFDLGTGQISLEGLKGPDTPKLLSFTGDPAKITFVKPV